MKFQSSTGPQRPVGGVMSRIVSGEYRQIWDAMSPAELAMYVGMFGPNAVPVNTHHRYGRMVEAIERLHGEITPRLGENERLPSVHGVHDIAA